MINYLATRGPELENFVIGSLIQLLCRVTKFGWFDDDKFREVVKEATNFLNQVTNAFLDLKFILIYSENFVKARGHACCKDRCH